MKVGTSFAVKSLDLDGGIKVKLQLWDLAGQPHFSSVRPVFYRGSVGGIMVFDVTRRETFNNIHVWYNEFSQVTGVLPFALLANKTDLVDQRQVGREEGEAYAQKNGWAYFETSAKDGIGIDEAFRLIAKQVVGKSR